MTDDRSRPGVDEEGDDGRTEDGAGAGGDDPAGGDAVHGSTERAAEEDAPTDDSPAEDTPTEDRPIEATPGDGGPPAGSDIDGDGHAAAPDRAVGERGSVAGEGTDGATVVDETPGDALLGGLIDRRLAAKTAVGFAVAGLVVYLLGWVVGWGEVLGVLSGARLGWLAVACLSTALGLAAWGKAWQVVLSVVGVEASYRRLVVTYFAATFANYVTPLGQAGGEPFIAYVLAADTEASYEDSLASVVTADLLNLLPFFNFAAVGLAWLLARASLPADARVLARGLVAMAVGVPAVVYLGWRRRDDVERAVLAAVRPVARRTGRVTVAGVRRRIEEFYGALEEIAADRRALAYALVFAYVGWVLFALPLYFSGLALGIELGVLLILFVVPASTLAGLVPTPGGLGGVESALVVLLVAVASVSAAQALALTVVYRVASYWFAVAVGGGAALWVVART